MPGPLTPRHKGTVCGDDEYAPINLGTRPGRRCWTAVRDRRANTTARCAGGERRDADGVSCGDMSGRAVGRSARPTCGASRPHNWVRRGQPVIKSLPKKPHTSVLQSSWYRNLGMGRQSGALRLYSGSRLGTVGIGPVSTLSVSLCRDVYFRPPGPGLIRHCPLTCVCCLAYFHSTKRNQALQPDIAHWMPASSFEL